MLYMVVDVWSRKIIAAQVHERESDELAATVLAEPFLPLRPTFPGARVYKGPTPTFRASGSKSWSFSLRQIDYALSAHGVNSASTRKPNKRS
jgi:hypothetical protein